jgi:hypothetical protein
VICPKCRELDQKSTIQYKDRTITDVYFPPYYDENGVYHHHDGNRITTIYTCSNDHRITTSETSKCPSWPECTWGYVKTVISVEGIESLTLSGGSGDIVIKND